MDYLRIYNSILPYGNRLFGRSVTVVNRSETVGRPLAALLANDGACVYSVDVTGVQQFTRGEGIRKSRHEVVEKEGWGVENCVPLSDVVICGVPGESFKLPTKLLREGAVCINFSTEKVCGFPLWLDCQFIDPSKQELRKRCQRQSLHLCSGNRKGHNRGASSKLAGKQRLQCSCRSQTKSAQRLVQNQEVRLDSKAQATEASTT